MAGNDYVLRNRQWLADKSQEAGINTLDGNILYKIIRKGHAGGLHPSRNSVVTVHYTGKTINGKVFDSSRGGAAPAMRLRDLIHGWIIALPHMQIGDRWEIYLPAEMGYGRFSQPGIPGGSTLIFDIELIAVN